MKKIAIGGEREYVKRLADYLIRRLPAHFRISSFTQVGHLLEYKDKELLYLLEEDFYQHCLLEQNDFAPEQMILIREVPSDDAYCRWQDPSLLIQQIERCVFSSEEVLLSSVAQRPLIGVYAPFMRSSLKDWIWPAMKTGDLYLGLEDLGQSKQSFLMGQNDVDSEEMQHVRESHMGELCYYIHLHQEEIIEQLSQMVSLADGRYVLDSPPCYFDFLGLEEEDYLWFYHLLKSQTSYGSIYVGLGNVAVSSLQYFKAFDQLILVDDSSCPKIHDFCLRLKDMIGKEGILKEDVIRICHRGA